MAIFFDEQTWVDIDKYVKQNAAVILPIGTTEEHGRHLPVGTDEIIARGFGEMLGDACDKAGIPALVMQTINFGFSMSTVRRWPGCPNVKPRVFEDYVYCVLESLVEMGFKKIVMLDCHGNHDCLLRMAMRELADKYDVYTMTLSPGKLADEAYQRLHKDPAGDIHGGEVETSMVLFLRPELVKTEEYTDIDAVRCNSRLRGPVSTWGLQDTKTGLYGNPTTACAELGKAMLEQAAEIGADYIREYRDYQRA